jgi:hypothetical protein
MDISCDQIFNGANLDIYTLKTNSFYGKVIRENNRAKIEIQEIKMNNFEFWLLNGWEFFSKMKSKGQSNCQISNKN